MADIATSNGKALFGRVIDLRVGTVDVSNGFRVAFKVKKNLKTEPNTCELKIYNLAQDNRDALQNAPGGKLNVSLSAGYEKPGTSLLFLGEARAASTEWDQEGNAITAITTGDSDKAMQESRLHMTIGPTMPVDVVLKAIVRAFGVGEGNVEKAAASLKSGALPAMYGPGSTFSGSAKRLLTDFCRSADLEWSVQDGNMQILERGAYFNDKAVLLSPDTGLKGSPSVEHSPRSKTSPGGITVKASAFLIPELRPGRKVVFKSRSVTGEYRIEQVEYTGDTHGEAWTADLTCRAF